MNPQEIIFSERPIAVTDLELTGLDPDRHEIIEFGLVVLHPNTLETLQEWETYVAPQHMERADPESLVIAGYDQGAWQGAVSIDDALTQFLEKTRGTVFAAWGAMDWMFVTKAMRERGLEPNDYFFKHPRDLWSVCCAFYQERIRESGISNPSLSWFSEELGIAKEPTPHRALNGARQAALVYRAILTKK
jgi:DNA polymerase III epsilon subunit-like protein